MTYFILLCIALFSHPGSVKCHHKPSALRAPSLPAYGWVPPAYSRGWLRFVMALH